MTKPTKIHVKDQYCAGPNCDCGYSKKKPIIHKYKEHTIQKGITEKEFCVCKIGSVLDGRYYPTLAEAKDAIDETVSAVTKHTPTPWELEIIKDDEGIPDEIYILPSGTGIDSCEEIAEMTTQPNMQANAEFIVKATQLHEKQLTHLSENHLDKRKELGDQTKEYIRVRQEASDKLVEFKKTLFTGGL